MKVMAKQQAGLAKAKFRFVKMNTLSDAVAVSTRALRLGGPELAEAPLSMMIIASHHQLEQLIEEESKALAAQGEKDLQNASDDEASDIEDTKEIETTMKWIIPVTGDSTEEGKARDASIADHALVARTEL